MKKITITVDEVTLAKLEILRNYYWSNSSSVIRRAVNDLENSICDTAGYDVAVREYQAKHPELFGSGA